jgi:hypothetical protein
MTEIRNSYRISVGKFEKHLGDLKVDAIINLNRTSRCRK